MQNLFLKPARDADGNPVLVRDHIGFKPLDIDGEWKPATQYWLNRVRDGDVIDGTEAKRAEADAAVDGDTLPPRKAKPLS